MIVAGCVYVAGALGMELVGGAWAAKHGQDNLVYSLLTTVEEGLELTGLVLFIRTLLDNLAANSRMIALRFDADGYLRLTTGPRYLVPVEAVGHRQVGDEPTSEGGRLNGPARVDNVLAERRRTNVPADRRRTRKR
jgi:hypothetical protein